MAAVEVQSKTCALLQEKCPKVVENKEEMEVPPTVKKVVENKEEEEGAVDPVSDAAIAKEVETKLEINNDDDDEEALESEKPNEGVIEEMDSKKTQKAVSVVPVDEPEEVEDAKEEGVILDEALEETKEEKEEKVEVEEASKEINYL